MQRTNIYLSDTQLESLRRVGEQRGASVAELVRQAVDSWLESQGVQVMTEDEWEKRFASLLGRREAASPRVKASTVERDVATAIAEVRRRSAARRR